MIYSEKQYSVSSAQLAQLKGALVASEARPAGQAWLKQAEIEALKSQIVDVEAELAEYDRLKSGAGLVLEICVPYPSSRCQELS